jgi:hypothetical protein
MAGNWTKMTYFAFCLQNQPGELARFTAQLRDASIDLLGLWGYTDGQERPRISCVPTSPDTFRGFMEEGGVEVEEGRTFYFSAANHPGALVDSLKGIADIGVNIDTIECIAADNQYGCFIWSDARDWDELDALLT